MQDKKMERSEFETQVHEKLKKFEELVEKGAAMLNSDELQKQMTHAKESYEKLQSAGADAWEDMRVGFQILLNDLSDTVKSASERFATHAAKKDSAHPPM